MLKTMMMNRYALFLGCTTPTQVIQYELSSRWVCRELGIELVDIEDFVCCGINQVNLSQEAGLLLAALNLAYSEAQDLDILTLCAACTGHLAEAVEKLKNQETRDRVNNKLKTVGLEYKGNTKVKHISRVLYQDIGIERIKRKIKIDLSKLRAAPHYGCHYLKPKSAFEGFDDPENPNTLHHLIAAAGALPVSYETLNLCCGGKSFPVSKEVAFYLVQKKLNNLTARDIDCLVVQCQTCYLMYSEQQKVINKKLEKKYNIPVILYPQLLGLALGADPKSDLGLDLNTIYPGDLLRKAGISTKI
ncbi:MAG: CoB--CoM heterodisulfide reductase iron-sulfur subunit B family protein [Candidatus Aminicenantes bacterium]|nr:CoB--CoM heterodisulfide reductase iron-sulfur subunit B family protein [Candidatus Aminicenantes bacterium]